MTMLVNIPFSSTSERNEPLRKCIAKAADEMGVSQHHAALLMSHFFEELSNQMSRNRLVTVPGFGTFGPKAWFPRNDPDSPGYAYPAFSGAIPLRNLIRSQCPTTGAALDGIDNKRKNAAPRSVKGSRMPFSAQRAFRDRIHAQAARLGVAV